MLKTSQVTSRLSHTMPHLSGHQYRKQTKTSKLYDPRCLGWPKTRLAPQHWTSRARRFVSEVPGASSDGLTGESGRQQIGIDWTRFLAAEVSVSRFFEI